MTSIHSDPNDKERLISLSEAAEIYDFNADYLGQLARRGRLKAQKVGWMWVTTPTDVALYLIFVICKVDTDFLVKMSVIVILQVGSLARSDVKGMIDITVFYSA